MATSTQTVVATRRPNTSARPASTAPAQGGRGGQHERKGAEAEAGDANKSEREERKCRTEDCKHMTKFGFCNGCFAKRQQARGYRKCENFATCNAFSPFPLCKKCFEEQKRQSMKPCATEGCPILTPVEFRLCSSCHEAERRAAMLPCSTKGCAHRVFVSRAMKESGTKEFYCTECWRQFKNSKSSLGAKSANKELRPCQNCKVMCERRLCKACSAADWQYTVRNCRECGLRHAGACGSSNWIRT